MDSYIKEHQDDLDRLVGCVIDSISHERYGYKSNYVRIVTKCGMELIIGDLCNQGVDANLNVIED